MTMFQNTRTPQQGGRRRPPI